MNENLIHVKIEYEEAFQSKKDILSLEVDLLEIVKSIERYKNLRMNELRMKNSLNRKTKEILTEIRKLQNLLPKVEKEKEKKKIKGAIKESYDKGIESELEDIKEKLRALGA